MGIEYDLYEMTYLAPCPVCDSIVRVPRYYLSEVGFWWDQHRVDTVKKVAASLCSCSSDVEEEKGNDTTPKIRKIRCCTQVHKKESNGNESPLRYL